MSRGSQRRRSLEAVMLDASPAREKLHRCPLYSVTISIASSVVAREVVTDSGLLLTGKIQEKISHFAPAWNYRKQLRHTSTESIPRSVQFLFHMGEQRVYMKHVLGEYKSTGRMMLDLTKSPLRDRILLHKGMRLVFQYRNQIREINITEVPPTEVIWGWDCKFEEREFLTRTLTGSPAEIASSDQTISSGQDQSFSDSAQTTTKAPIKQARMSDLAKKSISWSKTVTVVSETLGEVEEVEDNEDNESLPSTMQDQGTLVLQAADRPGVGVSLTSVRKTIFFGMPSPDLAAGLVYDSSALADPLFDVSTGIFAAITFCTESRQGYLVLPRINQNHEVNVSLVVPDDTALPVLPGDVITLEQLHPGTGARRRMFEMCVRGHRLVRSAPDGEGGEDVPMAGTQSKPQMEEESNSALFDVGLESSQAMKDIGVEMRQQQRKKRWNGSVDVSSSGSSPLTYFYKSSFFGNDRSITIGRSHCDISVSDPYLSKHHATIFRKRNKYFLLRPENKVVYLLLGKKDSHARPPLPLRTGDILTIGKSDFKVIFQQRGAGTIVASREEEMRLKVPCPGRPGCEVTPSIVDMKDRSIAKAESDDYVPSPVFDNLEAVLKQFGITRSVTEPMMLLMSIRGPRRGAFFVCKTLETIIGSSLDADVSVPNDRRMSGLHARIYFDTKERRWMVQDLMSLNGSFIKFDGNEPILLTFGDIFVMGLTSIKVMGTPLASTTSTSRYGCTPQ